MKKMTKLGTFDSETPFGHAYDTDVATENEQKIPDKKEEEPEEE